MIGEGRCRAVVTLAPGRYAFRYVNEAGEYFDDADADGFEPNGYGQFHGILIVEHAPLNLTGRGGGNEPRNDIETGHDLRIGQRFGHAVAGHPYLANAEIEYFVEDQVIHLEGFVTSRLAKQELWYLKWGEREMDQGERGVGGERRRAHGTPAHDETREQSEDEAEQRREHDGADRRRGARKHDGGAARLGRARPQETADKRV